MVAVVRPSVYLYLTNDVAEELMSLWMSVLPCANRIVRYHSFHRTINNLREHSNESKIGSSSIEENVPMQFFRAVMA